MCRTPFLILLMVLLPRVQTCACHAMYGHMRHPPLLQRVFDRLKASAAAHVAAQAAADMPLLGAVPLSEAERRR